MKAKVQFIFDNIDNNLYTGERSAVILDLAADDYATLHQLAAHMQQVFSADRYMIEE